MLNYPVILSDTAPHVCIYIYIYVCVCIKVLRTRRIKKDFKSKPYSKHERSEKNARMDNFWCKMGKKFKEIF